MATLAEPMPRVQRDRFFLILSLAMIAVILAGFSLNLALGRSSFGLPLIYHVHAFVFMGWILIYLAQNLLIATGADKAEAVKNAVQGEVNPQVQASILRTHPNVVFLLDKAAASLL